MPDTTAPHYRLVFLTVNSSYSHSSLALPLLHSACRDLAAWEWFRCDTTIAGDVMGAVREISQYNCDLLVTDLYLFNRKTALDILQRYHELAPACRIAVGGPECLGDGAEQLKHSYPWLNAVFRGEGEEIFRDYLINFDLQSTNTSQIIPADGNASFAGWSESPYPVNDPFFDTAKPFVQIETQRGCPMNCFYCTSGGTRTRYRTLEQVREELQILSAQGVKELRLLDRTFNLPQERGAALLKMFREEFPQMKFHLELHPQFLGDELRSELMQALPGQLHIEAGIQCLNPLVQQAMGRRSDTGKALDGLQFLCRCQAFETHADLLAGLPAQHWQDVLDDTEQLMQINTAEIQLEVLKSLPGTPLRQIAADYGIKYAVETPYDVMTTALISLEEMQLARDLSRLLDLTYNHSYLHSAVLAMGNVCKNLPEKMLEFFHSAGGNANTVWDLKKRFVFLRDFGRKFDLTAALYELAYQWLRAGFPLRQGADEFSQKAESVPPMAQLIEGDCACRDARETKYTLLSTPDGRYFLAYNRGYALNRPAAIWFLPQDKFARR